MGLLDSVLGAVMKQGSGPSAGSAGGVMGMIANNPQLVQAIIGMLGSQGTGGLGGLVARFQQAGLGDAMASWIGTGPNQAVSADQMSSALGTDTVGSIASQLGLSENETAGQLSQLLPAIIDHLTPNGQLPADDGSGASAGTGDLMGMLGGLMRGR